MGVILPGFGFMTGYTTANVAQPVFDELEKRNKLYKILPIEHSYPVCWRCKSEVIFRLVPAWYICTEELKPRLIKAAQSVKWEPESNGKRMIDWLNNMGDWNISRKRYYGMPLPFYVCEDCGHVHVIGSKQELREKAVDPAKVDALPELHRPWIDEIEIKCPKCGKDIVLKKTRKGRKYYGCIDNPECDFMTWQRPDETKCPKCGGVMVEKGNKLVCVNEACGNVMNQKEK